MAHYIVHLRMCHIVWPTETRMLRDPLGTPLMSCGKGQDTWRVGVFVFSRFSLLLLQSTVKRAALAGPTSSTYLLYSLRTICCYVLPRFV